MVAVACAQVVQAGLGCLGVGVKAERGKVLAAAEDRMAQLKVERGAVARYFESLGDVLTNAQKMGQAAQHAVDVPVRDADEGRAGDQPAS